VLLCKVSKCVYAARAKREIYDTTWRRTRLLSFLRSASARLGSYLDVQRFESRSPKRDVHVVDRRCAPPSPLLHEPVFCRILWQLQMWPALLWLLWTAGTQSGRSGSTKRVSVSISRHRGSSSRHHACSTGSTSLCTPPPLPAAGCRFLIRAEVTLSYQSLIHPPTLGGRRCAHTRLLYLRPALTPVFPVRCTPSARTSDAPFDAVRRQHRGTFAGPRSWHCQSALHASCAGLCSRHICRSMGRMSDG
jgi:hypothetical protein